MQPTRRVLSRAGLVLAMLVLTGCATTAEVTKGGGTTIGEAQAEKYDGPKARITVGAIVDKTGSADKKGSLRYQLDVLRRRSSSPESFQSENVVGGIRDLVTTALFQSNRFIVLERETISDALVEQEFSASGKVGEASRIPIGQVEGAELLVVGALTGFDAAAAGGGGFPIPIPINRGRDFMVLDVEIRKSHVAMDYARDRRAHRTHCLDRGRGGQRAQVRRGPERDLRAPATAGWCAFRRYCAASPTRRWKRPSVKWWMPPSRMSWKRPRRCISMMQRKAAESRRHPPRNRRRADRALSRAPLSA